MARATTITGFHFMVMSLLPIETIVPETIDQERTRMTDRRQTESLLLGLIAGGIVAVVIVFLVSLVFVFGDDTGPDPAAATPTTAAAPIGGPPEGRGPGSGGGATATPLAYGTANDDVLAAFDAGGCVACHSIKGVGGGDATVGPPLFRTGAIAADRRPGPSVEAYIKESITDPDAFIMPNCPTGPCSAGVMPKTLAESLSVQQIETIVDYLSALGTNAETGVLSP